MTFLNGILAFGSLAFTVPLAIHLLFRSRFRKIDWGAMYLLEPVVRINRRRIQLLHLLLLMLRCILPVLLAFCLARPLLTGFQSLPGDAPQTLILVIDDSRSMNAREADGTRRMDRVKTEFNELLAGLSRRDEVMVIRMSQIDAPAAAMSAQDAVEQLRKIRAEFGPVDLGMALQASVEAADQAANAQRRIIIASDFPSQMIGDAAVAALNRMSSRLEEKSIRPVISYWNLGTDSDQLENVFVRSVRVDSPAVVAGRTARFTAEIQNASDQPVRDLRVVWSLNGQAMNPVSLDVPPRSNVTSPLSRVIDEIGVHELSVAIEHGDALLEDNERSIGIDVIREVRVLLVDGAPSPLPLQGETDFLAIALSPFAFGGEDQPDAVRTSIVSPTRLQRELESEAPDVVVLANVEKLRKTSREALARFVMLGGGLILFDGDQIDPDFYNAEWSCELGTWNLPAELGSIVGSPRGSDVQSPAEAFIVGDRNAQYSPWDVLGSSEDQPFADVEITAYRQLNSHDEPTDAESPSIQMLGLVNGDPLVLAARRGQGTVMQFAIACDTDWSNLPTRLVYLPMLQQSVLDLAGSRKQTTIDVGQDFSVSDREFMDATSKDANESMGEPRFSVTFPDGTEERLTPTGDDRTQFLVSTVAGPGLYRLSRTVSSENGKSEVTRFRRIVSVPAIESQLRDVDTVRLEAAANAVDGKVYLDLQTLEDDDRTRRYGREIWRWLLFGLLMVMIAELLLQQFTVRATTARVA